MGATISKSSESPGVAAGLALLVGFAGYYFARGRIAVSSAKTPSLPQLHAGLHPTRYVAPRGTPSVIDGDVFKSVWEQAPWSEEFVEIRGPDAPEGTGPKPSQATRVKMLWDDEYLYIAALMDLEIGQELVAKFTERNSPIFHTDVDFEVFVDAPGCCHNYKELELNAINTVWNLMLNRPYSDGGGEFSGRVAKEGDAQHWEVRKQRTATKILRGDLHDSSRPSQWSCEIALAHSDTLDKLPVVMSSPSVGSSFRINFSRVEQNGQVNWVWAPQIVWNAVERKFEGKVNMHLPDAYGYVVFADERGQILGSPASAWYDHTWPVRLGAMQIYYGAHAYRDNDQKKAFPSSVLEMQAFVDTRILEPLRIDIVPDNASGFRATITDGAWRATIDQHRLLRVDRCSVFTC